MLTTDAAYSIQVKTRPTFYFIGVTTKKSSIMRVFPLWMTELGYSDMVIEGIDLQIHDSRENYRQVVAQIKHDPLSAGGLVTTHKIDILNAARDMFDFLDPYALICDEISSISKKNNRLEGHAKDPITSGLSLKAITGENYFATTKSEILCFGAGGSAVATLLYLINQKEPGNRPRRLILVNRSQGRLDSARAMVQKLETEIQVEYVLNADPVRNDEIMSGMPPSSIVINATGMGKDTPGSPITDRGLFPIRGIAWDFNYRGELDFLRQANVQKNERDLRIEDGWLYFLHGWTQVVAQVLHIDLTPALFNRMAELAETVR